MTRPATTAAIGLVLLSLAAPAAAQTRLAFVEAGLLADYDPTLHDDTTTKAGITGSLGVFVSRRWSVRAEVEYPQWHSTTWSGESRSVPNGIPRIDRFNLLEERRSPSISVLAGRDATPDSRVNLTLLGGVTITRRDSRTSGTIDVFDVDGNLIEHKDIRRDSGGYNWLALSAGADAAIALTKSLALVPQIRVHSYLYSEHTPLMFVRPRLALRYTF